MQHREEHREQLSLELDIRTKEYDALRNEINNLLNSAYQTTNLTIAAVGVALAAAPYMVQSDMARLFAIVAIVFYTICWIQLRYVRQVYNLSDHISSVIAPRVRIILNDLSPGTPQDYSSLLDWEASGGQKTHKSSLWLLPIEAARYGLPILGGLISFLTYLALVLQADKFDIVIDGPISLFCSTLFVYTGYATFAVRRLFLANE
ncbi:MAG: hypothetical protein KDD42_06130 [Bdellovibrionales bacterium]|nr:hypothetical protein [Bdellovibrionales bacterium]